MKIMGNIDNTLKSAIADPKILSKDFIQILLSSYMNQEDNVGKLIKSSWQEKSNWCRDESVLRETVGCIKIMSERMSNLSIVFEMIDNLHLSHSLETFLLAKVALQDIDIIFKHCKESSVIYGKYLISTSDKLSLLFKSSYQTLKTILDLLENYNPPQCVQKEIAFQFGETIDELLTLVLALNEIDILPFANTLRSLNRILNAKRAIIDDNFDTSKLFHVLFLCIKEKLSNIWLLFNDAQSHAQINKNLSKATNVVKFLVGMMLQHVKQYKNEINCGTAKSIVETLIVLQNLTPFILNSQPRRSGLYEEFSISVIHMSELILFEMLDVKDFVTNVRCIADKFCEFRSREEILPILLLLIAILSCLTRVAECCSEKWIEKILADRECYPSIMDKIFTFTDLYFDVNTDTLFIDFFEEKNRAVRDQSLYDYLYVIICAFLTTVSPPVYKELEHALVANIFFATTRSMLAVDILCFIARWCEQRLCCEMVSFFAYLYCAIWKAVTCRSNYSIRSSLLLERLSNVIGTEIKDRLMACFDRESLEFLPVWSSMNIYTFPQSSKEKCIRKFTSVTLDHLEKCEKNGQDPVQSPIFIAWRKFFAPPNGFAIIPVRDKFNVLHALMNHFNRADEYFTAQEQIFCVVLRTICSVVEHLDFRHLQKILETLDLLLESTDSELLQLQSCYFLSKLKTITFPPCQIDAILTLLSHSYLHLLTSETLYVHILAMRSLKEFAEVTSYAEIISKFLPEWMDKNLLSFLNKSFAEKPYFGKQPATDIFLLNADREHKVEKELMNIEHDLTNLICNIKDFVKKHGMRDRFESNLKALLHDLSEL